ncbi:MAG: hypothetical protein J6X54_00665 [Treponema sp.]|nr:hypothetical protein [Treponema sp.]
METEKMIHEKDRRITSAFIDSAVKLGVAQTVLLIQDNLTECFNAMDCDGVIFQKKFNAFWVFTKMKVRFTDRPDWNDKIAIKTYPIDNAGLRTHVNSEIRDKEGKTLVVSNQELCVLSTQTHRPMKLFDLPFPKEGFPPAVFNEPFERFPGEFNDDDFIYEHTIRSYQIDLSHHLNNIEYIKLALGVFDEAFLLSHKIKELEVHYTGESKEGQLLKIYKHTQDKKIYIYIKESLRTVFECCMEFDD